MAIKVVKDDEAPEEAPEVSTEVVEVPADEADEVDGVVEAPVAQDEAPADAAPVDPTVVVPTPGVYAPVSSQALPNAHRDATALAREAGVFGEAVEKESIRAVGQTGARGPRDLEALLKAHPGWVNGLDRLDELERAEGVANPAPWAGNPVDMLEAAKRYGWQFVDDVGNLIPRAY